MSDLSRAAASSRHAATDPLGQLRDAVVAAASSMADTANLDALRLERPPRPDLGDYSTNAAMLLAPVLGGPPRTAAERLGESLSRQLGADADRIEVAGPGFLNLFLADRWYHGALAAAVEAGEGFGAGVVGAPERILVEFVSANPTGPITVASGRHAAYGDSLARILNLAGHRVEREYYVNDHGSQVLRFGESIGARARGEEPPEDGYSGGYLADLAERIPDAGTAEPEELASRGVALMVEQIRASLERFRVTYDGFFSERSLYESKTLDRTIDLLADRGHVYESEGAVWLRTTDLGDDKDRVLRRSTGEWTYFASDIAYHEDKRERGIDRAIDVLGADHHGYVGRMSAAWRALGGDAERFEVPIMQLVGLTERGERQQMSKRRGEFVTLDELLDDIGVDATRFFLLQRSHETAFDIDLDLAREQSQDNPVYYVQYAHARIASIMRRAGEEGRATSPPGALTDSPEQLHPSARALIAKLLELPAEVRTAAGRRAPHRLTTYAHEVAQGFSAFYRDCRVLGAGEEGGDEGFRLALTAQTGSVIARVLGLLGVSAPERM